ncbi:hypothetical protein MMC17_007699 [Xylographa soralifera]|nr:hypothetical protein [Xylographa soralifera]
MAKIRLTGPPAAFFLILSLLTTNSQAQSTIGIAPHATVIPAPPGGGAPASPTGYPESAGGTPGFANYYFVLIGILAVLIVIAWLVARRTRRRNMARRGVRADGTTITEGQTRAGRHWRMAAVRDPRREEGLDERGEAPPPYIPGEPAPVHDLAGDGQDGIALQDYHGKPPDYDAHASSEEDLNLTRPPPSHPPNGQHQHHWTRHLLGRTDSSEPSALPTMAGIGRRDLETGDAAEEPSAQRAPTEVIDGVIR